jgi:hypothetical protein
MARVRRKFAAEDKFSMVRGEPCVNLLLRCDTGVEPAADVWKLLFEQGDRAG